jgi:hypothetical protein
MGGLHEVFTDDGHRYFVVCWREGCGYCILISGTVLCLVEKDVTIVLGSSPLFVGFLVSW